MAVNGIVIVTVQPLAGRWLAGRDPSLIVVAATALAATVVGYAGAVCIWTLGEIAMAAAGAAIVAGLAPAHLRGRYLGLYGRRLIPRGTGPVADLRRPGRSRGTRPDHPRTSHPPPNQLAGL
jgi:hypothetical protein